MRLFNRKKAAISMKEQIVSFLERIEYTYRFIEENEQKIVIQTGVALTVGNSESFIVINHEFNLVEISAYSPVKVPENKRLEVAKFLDLADHVSYIGNLQLNHRDGSIRCKTYFCYGNENLEQNILSTNFFGAFNMIERYIPGVMRITYGGKDADSAIAEINGEINPSNN